MIERARKRLLMTIVAATVVAVAMGVAWYNSASPAQRADYMLWVIADAGIFIAAVVVSARFYYAIPAESGGKRFAVIAVAAIISVAVVISTWFINANPGQRADASFKMASILIYGGITGGSFALLALGFTLIYGVADVVNMAHGATFMLGAYMFYAFGLRGFAKLEPVIALIVAAIVVGIIGSIIYGIFINPILEDVVAVLVVTVGVALILQQTMTIVWGIGHHEIFPLVPDSFELWNVTVPWSKVLSLTVSLALFISLWILMIKSKIGGAMRAAAQDHEVAMLMGINTTRLHMLVMAIASSFAAIAGILIPTSTSQMADPFMWLFPLVMSFSIVILGGLGSIKGTFIGAFIVGYAEICVITVAPGEGAYLQGAAALGIMIAILLLRPKGLFGKRIELED